MKTKKFKEILVLHHSHLDVGYTHSQRVIMELQNEFLDQVLDFLDETADRKESDRPKWTCEVTAPVVYWLKTAPKQDVERFRAYLAEGRIGISGFEYNTTPLCSAEQLIRQLQPARELAEQFDLRIRTANQHDVNGLPWTAVDLLLDCGIDFLTMAVNQHLGRAACERPGVFRWQGPSGREITVMNSHHYTMFDQHLLTWEHSLEKMQTGWEKLAAHLESMDYPFDFVYLTTTNCPQMWDNSPPNMDVANLIQHWNAEVDGPKIRYVTAAELREKVRALDPEQLPVHRGDWTDYWNFGCAATAADTALNQNTRSIAATADFLNAFTAAGNWQDRRNRALKRAWDSMNLYSEHTWCCALPVPSSYVFQATSLQKSNFAFSAREEAFYALTSALEAHAGNPPQSQQREYVLLVNPGQTEQTLYPRIPEAWRKPGKRLRSNQMQTGTSPRLFESGELCAPVTLPPFSWKKLALDTVQAAEPETGVAHGMDEQVTERRGLNQEELDQERHVVGWMESPSHRLSYNPVTGRVLSLIDRQTGEEVVDTTAELGFFEFIRERGDHMIDSARTAMYCRDLDKEKFDITCWQHNWSPVRERAYRPLSCEVVEDAISRTLIRRYEAPGVEQLEQRIRLRVDSPIIELEVSFEKQAYEHPESIYFAFPLKMAADWQCHFDTAGMPVSLDAEQLPGACRDWVTADSYVCMHQPSRSFTLLTPEAPMVQAGGFNFCKESESIPRDSNPLLLSWACNNYWDTNFPQQQTGRIELRYGFVTGTQYDAQKAHRISDAYRRPAFAYPSFSAEGGSVGAFLSVEGNAEVTHVKLAEDGLGLIVRLLNLSDSVENVRLQMGGPVRKATICSPTEIPIVDAEYADATVSLVLESRRITTLRIEMALS